MKYWGYLKVVKKLTPTTLESVITKMNKNSPIAKN
ncbi:hypothetical protein ES703_64335 [subsurface metagenome]